MTNTFTTTPPYYLSLDKTTIPKSEDENSICKVGGDSDITHYFSLYVIEKTFLNNIIMSYTYYLSKWIDDNYTTINCEITETCKGLFTSGQPLSYTRNNETIHCNKYTIETPYNSLKIHIENAETSPDIVYIFTNIFAKLPKTQIANSETKQLEEILTSIRKKIVEDNMYHNDEYYEELSAECAIDYARDHC